MGDVNGEQEIGYSVFRLTSGMDEGPIAAAGRVSGEGYVGAVLDRLDDAALPELVRVAQEILNGPVAFCPQPHVEASYADGPRRPSDGEISTGLGPRESWSGSSAPSPIPTRADGPP